MFFFTAGFYRQLLPRFQAPAPTVAVIAQAILNIEAQVPESAAAEVPDFSFGASSKPAGKSKDKTAKAFKQVSPAAAAAAADRPRSPKARPSAAGSSAAAKEKTNATSSGIDFIEAAPRPSAKRKHDDTFGPAPPLVFAQLPADPWNDVHFIPQKEKDKKIAKKGTNVKGGDLGALTVASLPENTATASPAAAACVPTTVSHPHKPVDVDGVRAHVEVGMAAGVDADDLTPRLDETADAVAPTRIANRDYDMWAAPAPSTYSSQQF